MYLSLYMQNFILLKKTYPISLFERECDAYKFIVEHTTESQRSEWGITLNSLKKTILPNEKYIYQVGKELGNFKVLCCSFENFIIIRKHLFGEKDYIVQ
jgi:hypothetical protein